MSLYELNKKLKIGRQRGFKFNQIFIFKIKIYSYLQSKNLHY